jgi:glycosyltransferase involved in cell wall biosynthesis
MILNLHPGFLEGRFTSKVLDHIICFPNGTDVVANRIGLSDVAKIKKRIAVNCKFERVKGCWGLADLFLSLWQNDSDISVIWTGDGSEREAVLSYLRNCGVPDEKFISPGQIPKKQALLMLATAEIAINGYEYTQSLKWNYVLKIPEFMSIGLPVVSVDTPGVREYIADDDTGKLFNPGDWSHAKELILELLVNAVDREKITTNALARIARYDWKVINRGIADKMLSEIS